MRVINEIHLARPFLGSCWIADELKDRGFTVNRKRVQRLMRLMGITAIYPKPKTSKAARGHKIHPYLLRGPEPERANQVWVADITYLLSSITTTHPYRFRTTPFSYDVIS